MTTLTEFLLDRIAEDEASLQLHWQVVEGGVVHLVSLDQRRAAECEVKRRIVERCRNGDWTTSTGSTTLDRLLLEEHACESDVLALLAQPYADHPDFDEGWRE